MVNNYDYRESKWICKYIIEEGFSSRKLIMILQNSKFSSKKMNLIENTTNYNKILPFFVKNKEIILIESKLKDDFRWKIDKVKNIE